MASASDTNPSAFARPFSEQPKTTYTTSSASLNPAQSGMTLLDYFAGQALAGMLADPSVFAEKAIAASAYRVAEYMLEERQRLFNTDKA